MASSTKFEDEYEELCFDMASHGWETATKFDNDHDVIRKKLLFCAVHRFMYSSDDDEKAKDFAIIGRILHQDEPDFLKMVSEFQLLN